MKVTSVVGTVRTCLGVAAFAATFFLAPGAGVAQIPAATGRDGNPGAQGPLASTVVPAWEQVNLNGFGTANADEVSALGVFSGFLYAGTWNPLDGARILRSQNGSAWTAITEPGFGIAHDIAPPAILDLTTFNGRLYASTGRGDGPGQVWRTLNGVNWAPMVISGFSDPDNVDVTVLIEYNSMLFAGVTNVVTGAQIWQSSSGDSGTWTQVAPATPDDAAATVTGMAVFDGGLYAAVEFETGAPAQIWRSFGGAWSTVVSDGFGETLTSLVGGMTTFGGKLYVGAGNTADGAQVWRSADGEIWEQVNDPAFGDANNLRVESVFVFENSLYASTRNTASGIELWRSTNGTLWERANQDGFGDAANSGTNGSNSSAEFLTNFYAGTLNGAGGEVWRMRHARNVNLSPASSLAGAPGGKVVHTLTITNTGSMADGFDLSAGGQTWTTAVIPSVTNLPPSASTTFPVTVTVPPGAANLESDTVTITATSQGDGTKSDTALLTTTAILTPVRGVALSPNAAKSGSPGGKVVYTLTITNTGNVADSFGLSAGSHAWVTTFAPAVANLPPSSSATVAVTVTIPPGASNLASDAVTLTATSQGDGTKKDAAILTTTALVGLVRGVTLSPNASLSGTAGANVVYTLTVTNTGNAADSFGLTASAHSWTTTFTPLLANLPPAGSADFAVTVNIPPGAASQESETVTITATSEGDSSKSDTVVLTTTATGQSFTVYLSAVFLNAPP